MNRNELTEGGRIVGSRHGDHPQLPKIDTDDLLLFGSLALAAIGAAFVTATTTNDGLAALGVALIVFGVPAALITFMASGESK